jgi:endonuclease YncB( thermonuclease family)
MTDRVRFFLILAVLLFASVAVAESFTGKVVKVTDGDTIQVRRNRTP